MNRPEALTDNNHSVEYETVRLSPVDPLSAIEALVEKGLTKYFWIYGSEDETIIALDPIGEVVIADNQVRSSWKGERMSEEVAADPLAQIGRLLDDMPMHNWRAFGYITFDTAGYYLPYSLKADTPQVRFTIPKTELVITTKETVLRTLEDPEKITSTIQEARSKSHASPNAPTPDFSDRETYEHQVEELIGSINDGELVKAIIARRVRMPGSIDIFSTFATIHNANPAARTFCFSQPDLSGVGSSPELLMQTTKDGLIITNPLAGTRPRGSTPEQDETLRKELQNDPKEAKEHEISVQLAKEELESVCTPGSVRIKDYMQIAPFRTVQHLSSSVVGQLNKGRTLWDGLRVLFPGVTVSGVDKSAAVERIAAIEQIARGPYGGCVGWIDSHGASDLAISIRSAFEDASGVSVSAGAGIIAESIPKREYEETAHKMLTIQSQLVLRK